MRWSTSGDDSFDVIPVSKNCQQARCRGLLAEWENSTYYTNSSHNVGATEQLLVVYNFVLVERNLLLFVIPYIIIIYSLRKEVDIMNYISVKAASEKWGISERRIQKLCEENRIDGTEKFGRAWMIPKDAEKPVDGRMKTRNKQEENHGI